METETKDITLVYRAEIVSFYLLIEKGGSRFYLIMRMTSNVLCVSVFWIKLNPVCD